MKQSNTLIVVDKLVISAFKLEEIGKSSFTAEDLVVSAWEHFPDTFGIRGYRDEKGNLKFPDTNRVYAEIMGSKPIRKRGLLIKIGTKKYQLTESGRELGRLLTKREEIVEVEKAGFPRDIETRLKALLESRAMKKSHANQEDEVTFFDACNFWNISPRSSPIELEGKLKNLETILESARSTVGNKIVTFRHSGETFSSKELDHLCDIHSMLMAKFKTQLDTIRKRRDRRP